MESGRQYLVETDAPPDRSFETLDARELPPPKPLRNTLERLTELDDETSLIQINDREPQHLYPKLTDRGFEFETIDTDEGIVTVIWRP